MNLISTAVIGKTYGVEGFLYVYSLSGETKHLEKLKGTDCILSFPDGRETTIKVETIKTHGDNLLMRFFGYETPEKAKVLSKAVIKIDRALSPKLKKGEVYVADLIGLNLCYSGEVVGTVAGISDGAQSILLHVKSCSDDKIRLVPYMYPFTEKAKLEEKTITLLMKDVMEV